MLLFDEIYERIIYLIHIRKLYISRMFCTRLPKLLTGLDYYRNDNLQVSTTTLNYKSFSTSFEQFSVCNDIWKIPYKIRNLQTLTPPLVVSTGRRGPPNLHVATGPELLDHVTNERSLKWQWMWYVAVVSKAAFIVATQVQIDQWNWSIIYKTITRKQANRKVNLSIKVSKFTLYFIFFLLFYILSVTHP